MNEPPAPTKVVRSRRPFNRLIGIVIAIIIVGLAGLYRYVTTGGMVARQKPSALEGFVAQRLVALSVPKAAKAMKSPLEKSDSNLAQGCELYRKNCESCHGYDGRGKTSLSGGLY